MTSKDGNRFRKKILKYCLSMQGATSLQRTPLLFREKNSAAIRIWHWLTFLTITASLITVLFASTIFTVKDNISLVQEQIQEKGGAVSPGQARAVAHEYNDKFWNLHKFTGYGLCLLLLSRMVIEAYQSKEQKLTGKIKKALQLTALNDRASFDKTHYLLVKRGYLLFYLFLLIMALTGLGLAYEEVPFLKANHSVIKSVHSFVQYLIYFYIVAHLVGVIRADLTNNKGIVSRMINGSAG